jgi:oxidase EvaA
MKNIEYKTNLEKYKKVILDLNLDTDYFEFNFEALKDWSLFYTFEEIEKWYKDTIDKQEMTIKEIPLDQCKNWNVDGNTIHHNSGEFFSILGLRVSTNIRECEGGWDQPIVKQTGWDGGILGILRKRFDGVPHYLIEAKSEPGNTNIVQLSPTLAATFSNIKKAHEGNTPNYLNFFEEDEKYKVHYKKWLAEDGGRLYNKRNLNMIVEVDEDQKVDIVNENFRWMSLHQIKKCCMQDAWVGQCLRSIIAHV